MSLGDVASVATLLLFITYIAGRVWRVKIVLDSKFDVLEVKDFSEDIPALITEEDNYIDLGGPHLIKLSSPIKIRQVTFHKIDYSIDDSGDMQSKLNFGSSHIKIEPHECLYIGIELSETLPLHQIRIEYIDFSIATFGISENRRNGSIEKENYEVKSTIKTYLYYLVI
ncbi:hypothetical protein J3A84_05460 [Proteiniclasticum sp. SCR006]|uniref:Uncharacterized protein n=1 Tax=Proteiniclasticum aestuarii TaxID=2817862 RepID=A0A939H7C6_9CLOT|nr:hypothetical protein [Proteiniclasticum aestuarii]MBO1264486.1 hypothetical protein [Proteiniclasticum aestuarii]